MNKKDGIVTKTFHDAYSCYQAGQLTEAEQFCREILADHPNQAECLTILGLIAYNTNRFEDAERQYRKAIAANSDFPDAYNNLGSILREKGKLDEAVTQFRQAVALNPGHIMAHMNLGSVFIEQNNPEMAKYHLGRCLELDPSDRYGSRLRLAKIGTEEVPVRAGETYIKELYAARAATWDKNIANSYQGHFLLSEALSQLSPGPEKINILDIGCGTGLTGSLIRQKASALEGIDISSAMLEKAKAKNVYDKLFFGDFITVLKEYPKKYDVVISAATLIHFGDLAPAFQAISHSVSRNGLFLCTLFPSQQKESISLHSDLALAQGGCYCHREDYIRSLATETGCMRLPSRAQ